MSDVRKTLGDLDLLDPSAFDDSEVMEAFSEIKGQSYKTPIVATAANQTWTGDQTFSGALNSTGTLGTGFGTAAAADTGTSGETVPLLNGDNTFSGDNTFTGALPNFTGMIAAFGTVTPPDGWIVANGATASRTVYADLFAVIGTAWNTGGEASTHFRLPNMCEAAPTGIGTRGVGAAADVYTLGLFKDDAFQGWQTGGPGVFGEANIIPEGAGTNRRLGQYSSGGQAGVDSIIARDDGTNGTPRTGTTTHGKRVGVQYCIKY